jgi:hypothetical protein
MSEWLESPPSEEEVPFYPCWVWDGEMVTLASWGNGKWKTGNGVVYDESKITHYQYIEQPFPPKIVNNER